MTREEQQALDDLMEYCSKALTGRFKPSDKPVEPKPAPSQEQPK